MGVYVVVYKVVIPFLKAPIVQTLPQEAPERHSNNKFKGVMEAIATVVGLWWFVVWLVCGGFVGL